MSKVCLITGAARRIGAVIVRAYHAQGYNVIVHYHRSEQEAGALIADLNTIRDQSAAKIAADLCDLVAIEQLAQQAQSVFGRIDVLVHNASVFFPTSAVSATLEDWDELVTTNLRAPYFLSQACFSALKISQGSVIAIADIQGMKPIRDYAIYGMTQAALLSLVRSLAKEWEAHGIRVNAVAPGPILPPEGRAAMTETEYRHLVEKTKEKRLPTPLEVATACLELSESTKTGEVILMDAGRLFNCLLGK